MPRAGSHPGSQQGAQGTAEGSLVGRPGSVRLRDARSTLKSPHRLITPPSIPLCHMCSQPHDPSIDTHKYDYETPVDQDLNCPLCKQPLVDPVDATCGHTFCQLCIVRFFRTNCAQTNESRAQRDADANSEAQEEEEEHEDFFGLCPVTECHTPISWKSMQPASSILTKYVHPVSLFHNTLVRKLFS